MLNNCNTVKLKLRKFDLIILQFWKKKWKLNFSTMPWRHVPTSPFLSSLHTEPFTGYYASMALDSAQGGGPNMKIEQ